MISNQNSNTLKSFLKEYLAKYYFSLLRKQLDVVNVDLSLTQSNLTADFTLEWKIYKAKNPKTYRILQLLNESGLITVKVFNYEKKALVWTKEYEDKTSNFLAILNEKFTYQTLVKITKKEILTLKTLCERTLNG